MLRRGEFLLIRPLGMTSPSGKKKKMALGRYHAVATLGTCTELPIDGASMCLLAEATLRRIVELDEESAAKTGDSRWLALLGDANYNLERFREAVSWYVRSAALESRFFRESRPLAVLNRLARSLIEIGASVQAVALLQTSNPIPYKKILDTISKIPVGSLALMKDVNYLQYFWDMAILEFLVCELRKFFHHFHSVLTPSIK